ncbi:hypothetical protein BKA56DRAFT_597066 [Ilyonectria sp. MPI-CAGE-AT-0026]|nr:hypothetical protein BKA56DRAFT_597066 [Ilyonectria sp. MPI-CAGE-AT-0026]
MLDGDLHDDTITTLTQASNVLGHRGLRSGNLSFEPTIAKCFQRKLAGGSFLWRKAGVLH